MEERRTVGKLIPKSKKKKKPMRMGDGTKMGGKKKMGDNEKPDEETKD